MKIIFKNQDNSIRIITLTEEALSFFSIEAIAEKDVPKDLPYWIVKDSDIPTDRTYRDALSIDESQGEPDGFGKTSSEFDAKLLAKYMESIR